MSSFDKRRIFSLWSSRSFWFLLIILSRILDFSSSEVRSSLKNWRSITLARASALVSRQWLFSWMAFAFASTLDFSSRLAAALRLTCTCLDTTTGASRGSTGWRADWITVSLTCTTLAPPPDGNDTSRASDTMCWSDSNMSPTISCTVGRRSSSPSLFVTERSGLIECTILTRRVAKLKKWKPVSQNTDGSRYIPLIPLLPSGNGLRHLAVSVNAKGNMTRVNILNFLPSMCSRRVLLLSYPELRRFHWYTASLTVYSHRRVQSDLANNPATTSAYARL